MRNLGPVSAPPTSPTQERRERIDYGAVVAAAAARLRTGAPQARRVPVVRAPQRDLGLDVFEER